MQLINKDNTVNMQEFARIKDKIGDLTDESIKQQAVAWSTINEIVWKLSKGDHCSTNKSGIENSVAYIVQLYEKAAKYDALSK
jgi:hypothetical protein